MYLNIENIRFKDHKYIKSSFVLLKILKDALRTRINNPFKEIFYGKRKKKKVNVLTVFSIFNKSGVKTFLKWIVNHSPKGTR